MFQDKIWLLAGYDSSKSRNDVWHSTNGKEWLCVTPNAPWSVRYHSHALVFQNRLWIMGGSPLLDGKMWIVSGCNEKSTYFPDVWYSQDGEQWTNATMATPFAARSNHELVVWDNRLWLMGGWSGKGMNDVWYSYNGKQ